MKKLFKISITGPESSGKSTLASELSEYFNFPCVPEYARDYLVNGGQVIKSSDLVALAHQQIQLENEALIRTQVAILCDTDMLVLKVWCLEIFQTIPASLSALHRHHPYDLTLLCSPDIAWQPDPLRVNPLDRMRLFDIYQNELQRSKSRYHIIEGIDKERTIQAIKIIKSYLKED